MGVTMENVSTPIYGMQAFSGRQCQLQHWRLGHKQVCGTDIPFRGTKQALLWVSCMLFEYIRFHKYHD